MILSILKFAFVFFLVIEFTVCFRSDIVTNFHYPVQNWTDIIIPPGQCWATLPFAAVLFVLIAVGMLIFTLARSGFLLLRFWDVRHFCTYVLGLPTSDVHLADLTWSSVQQRLIDVQHDIFLCRGKAQLDQLDIYNRILRFNNYLIAMVNKDILPVRFPFPFTSPYYDVEPGVSGPVGGYIYLSDGYLFNLKFLLFWSPWAPFTRNRHLRPDFKRISNRIELASKLAWNAQILGVLNLLFSPVVFIIQLLIFFCANAQKLRYEPVSFLGRRWSNYSRLYLRHFNELRHEFTFRLGSAYRPAARYLDCFPSRLLSVVAGNLAFIAGGASVILFCLGLIRDQLLHLPGYLAIVTGGGLLASACISLVPDENTVYCPKNALLATLMRIHYMPDHWKEMCHTNQVRSEFSQLFQYRLVGYLEELLSPLITPFLLMFAVPGSALNIVDFLRNYTAEVKLMTLLLLYCLLR
ncbi:unnamed protein product [Protopolystoma xenopodis]|uniref:Autophagy-related protein 9 n=1 Tax=Protopolystoma xenopodis TaxID=117903 RepID=A0A448WLN2_9PLAT|nr:unnamed protein product [Protopolystoma xenopodis]